MDAQQQIKSQSSRIDRGLNGEGRESSLRSAEGILHTATDIASKVRSRMRNVSGDALKGSVTFVKQYPVQTALLSASLGFIAGYFMCGRSKD